MSPKLITYFLCARIEPKHLYCIGILGNGYIFATVHCTSSGWAPTDLYFNNPQSQATLKTLFNLDIKSVQLNHKKFEFETFKDLIAFSIALASKPKDNAQRQYWYSQADVI